MWYVKWALELKLFDVSKHVAFLNQVTIIAILHPFISNKFHYHAVLMLSLLNNVSESLDKWLIEL